MCVAMSKFILVFFLILEGCGKPQAPSFQLNFESHPEVVTKAQVVQSVLLTQKDSEGALYELPRAAVAGVRSGENLEIEIPQDFSLESGAHWYFTGFGATGEPLLQGQGKENEETHSVSMDVHIYSQE